MNLSPRALILRLDSIAFVALATGALAAQPAPGVFDLQFFNVNYGYVTSLPVCDANQCEALILEAHVTDTTGQPVEGGLVTFQYCGYRGFPRFDIDRPDEAPSSACAAGGTGNWRPLGTMHVDSSGVARFNFGIVEIPRTVGFRFRYSGRGSGIENGECLPEDFEWEPAP